MNKREVIYQVLEGKRPPYVPWSFSFTHEAQEKLRIHYQTNDIEPLLQNHLLFLGNSFDCFKIVEDNIYQDIFGVNWDRSIDKDIGTVVNKILPNPTLNGYHFPNPNDPRIYANISDEIQLHGDRFRIFGIHFSLYERAWTMRGMQSFMEDFYDNPKFVSELLNNIADYNIAQINQAVKYDIDGIYFGDDWGQQKGLQMGPKLWRKFIYPVLQRMYKAVHEAGKYVFIHSCGDVDELFDDLIGIGLNCFNPFQPEVMDVFSLMDQYRGRLTFHGGLSTQYTLPYGTPEQVHAETQKLLNHGQMGGYILSPAHSVEGDVPLENILAFIDIAQEQL